MIDRKEVYARIDELRKQQDTDWPRDERRKQMYSFLPPHIVMLEMQLEKLRNDWYTAKRGNSISRLEHLAACAVRALEEIERDNV